MHDLIIKRVDNKPLNRFLNVGTMLQHFSILTYLVPYRKLRNIIPEIFDVYTIEINEEKYGLISAVTFVDKDFHFKNILPFLKFKFPQTNYRAYIIDKKTGDNCAWFFGTALGSNLVNIPKNLWKMPWFYAKYETNFSSENAYNRYEIEMKSRDASGKIDIVEDTNLTFEHHGFKDIEEAKLILTHPIKGYFYRSDNEIGKYKIWHPAMNIKMAKCNNAYFEKFEKLGLLTKEEMKNPYSVLLTNEIEFIIDLPPNKI